jgi:FAD/FMN-containing dehydrogenase
VNLLADAVLTELAALVYPSRVETSPTVCASLSVDGQVPNSAVSASTAEQVAAVLRYASEHHLAVIPRGNGTKLSMGGLPQRYDIALVLSKINRVIHYEPADLTITVEPGITFGAFQELTGKDRLWLPLDPRGGVESTVGGIIAANAAGPLRQGFGGPRDMVLGLKIATADGKIIKTGGRVVKNVAGYDFGKLLTGSFGTLGVIVEATLKLFPKPPERATFTMRAGTLGIARDLRRSLLASPLTAFRLVLLDAMACSLVGDSTAANMRPGPELWMEVGGSHRVVERYRFELEQLTSSMGTQLARYEKSDAAWNRVSDLGHWLPSRFPEVTVLKAALPLVASEEFLSRAQQEAESEQISLAGFAEVGLGIVRLCALQEKLASGTSAWVGRLRQAAIDLGGTLVIEHCPAELKRQVDVWGPGGDDLGSMHKMKVAWDPNAVLSPGRLVGL